ncbi:GntR family transcriptional regulator [Microbacterium sp.]|uniref:GntR family transcriptional regulator n=1 Tax=Microbacterium sp. TaxID=51671 RepID=UPI003C77A5C9
MLQPLETVTVADAATSRLRDRLFAGEYKAGEEIKDTQVASAFGIARPTARVAVQQLVNEGMLVRSPGFSARVRTFDPAQVRDIYRVRKLIELDAVREIRRASLPLDAVTAALQGFADLQGREDDWLHIAAADLAFHSAVVGTARSPRLQGYFAGIANESRLLIALLRAQYTDAAALYAEHEELHAALGGDTPFAALEEAWIAHLDMAQTFLEGHLASTAE